jgi:hypothetical protein
MEASQRRATTSPSLSSPPSSGRHHQKQQQPQHSAPRRRVQAPLSKSELGCSALVQCQRIQQAFDHGRSSCSGCRTLTCRDVGDQQLRLEGRGAPFVWHITVRGCRAPRSCEALAHPTARRLVLVATNWSSAAPHPLDSCYYPVYPYNYQANMLQTTTDDCSMHPRPLLNTCSPLNSQSPQGKGQMHRI